MMTKGGKSMDKIVEDKVELGKMSRQHVMKVEWRRDGLQPSFQFVLKLRDEEGNCTRSHYRTRAKGWSHFSMNERYGIKY
jgi:hypothetical protein